MNSPLSLANLNIEVNTPLIKGPHIRWGNSSDYKVIQIGVPG